MRKALKEEYIPHEWKAWRKEGYSSDKARKLSISPPIDIIVVQRLASTYERTWSKKLDDGSSFMWLRDLLPVDLPQARTMTFKYDSKWLKDPSFVSLRDCGDRLLKSILQDRTHRGKDKMCPIMARRPLILIGHSCGGLVIKQALVSAAMAPQSDLQHEDCLALITPVAGVIFLGTPITVQGLPPLLSTRTLISDYLKGIYTPSLTSTPFLHYAGEYWTHHALAADAWKRNISALPNNLPDDSHDSVLANFATKTLNHSVDIALVTCGALSSALNKIDLGKEGQLLRVIAIRDLKNALLPASQTTTRLKGALPVTPKRLRKLRAYMIRNHLLKHSSFGPHILVPDDAQNAAKLPLNMDLGSPVVVAVLALLGQAHASSPEGLQYRKWRQGAHLLYETSRALRRLTIFLAVDPTRSWLYSQVGGQGISPIPALAHTAEAIDTYLASALLPPKLLGQYDFRDQFYVEAGHPYYGPITATRHELILRPHFTTYIGPLPHAKMGVEIHPIMIATLEYAANYVYGVNPALTIWLDGPQRCACFAPIGPMTLITHPHSNSLATPQPGPFPVASWELARFSGHSHG
ncbi:MAG: hypothetical protein M1840_004955 [Geoglossum simile]|nr:MAG: hypothetical protein M1840_004955 [Geoglossum simile]